MHHNRAIVRTLFGALVVLFAIWSLVVSPVSAAPFSQDVEPTQGPSQTAQEVTPNNLSIGDDTCLECHGQPGLTMELENGEVLDLFVPPQEHAGSVHGEMGYACVQCHTTVGDYPHPKFSALDQRDVTLQLNAVCQRCHPGEYELTQDSAHAAAFNAGNREAAVCSDCHTAHDVRRLTDPDTGELTPDARLWIPQTCARCHSAIYNKYLDSVHGSTLIDTENTDVPTCIDCHGVHNIEDPTTAGFRLNSPQICANCHTDPEIMDKYGVSTEVLNTYVADFHGTSVVLFEPETPDAEINKPVCFDCHGVHDIAWADDPIKGLHVRQNLMARCQVCHPDATENFPDAWLSHYIPSPDKNALVYYVNLFYKILIPVVIGGMAVLVSMDAGRTLLNRYRSRKEKEQVELAADVKQPLPGQSKSAADESEVEHE